MASFAHGILACHQASEGTLNITEVGLSSSEQSPNLSPLVGDG